jgi:hypothetical protein
MWAAVGLYAVTSIDVSSALIDLEVGERLAITLRSGSATAFAGWGYASAYAGGDGFVRTSTSAPWSSIGLDHGFRTWVDTAVVPEPASGLLFGAGLIAFAAAGARRSRVR